MIHFTLCLYTPVFGALPKVVRNLLVFILISTLSIGKSSAQQPVVNVDSTFNLIHQQLANMLGSLDQKNRYPRTYNEEDFLVTVTSDDWTSGFFPGMLWYMYEYTKDTEWKKHAQQWTAGLEFEKYNSKTHDLGFMLYTSFGNGYRLTKRSHYKNVLIAAANTLITRYNPKVGCIQSWEQGKWKYPVIIDNMMNLELLFWASKITGNSKYATIAIHHANTTLKNQFREDGSSWHVLDYDPKTGNIRSKTTAQGYSDDSSWARGQAWGLYGFTMTYRETKDSTYLNQAEKIAEYIIQNLEKTKIPYWDFKAPYIPFVHKDASAAAITASALLELSSFSKKSHLYCKIAEEILHQLCTPEYLAKAKSNGNFILNHSIGHKPDNSEVDVPLIYADYYFIEALLRYKHQNQTH